MSKGLLAGLSLSFSAAATPPESRKVADTIRAFDIGRTGRRLTSIPTAQTAINSLIQTYGNQAVARSRYLALNNPYATSAKETFVSALVGSGIKPSKLALTADQKKAFVDLWNDWCPYADANGMLDFYGLQALAAGELFEAGECFAVLDTPPTEEPGVVPVAVRLYQSEMLPYWMVAATGPIEAGNYISMGIEFDSNHRRVAYHFLRRAPGDFTSAPLLDASNTVRIEAARVMHLYRPIRVGQIRGIPFTLSGMVTLAMMDLYDDAELERKRTAALFAGFVTSEDPEDDGSESPLGAIGSLSRGVGRTQAIATLEPGAMVPLGPGEDVKFSEPADLGGSYEAFQYRMLLRAAAGFGVPYSAFTGDMRQVNYSSMRAGLVEFRRRIGAMQSFVMIQAFARPFWNAFVIAATESGLAPWKAADYFADKAKFHRVKWLPPKFDWVDPLKDIEAEALAVTNGFKARTDVIEAVGDDAESTDERIHEDRLREEELAKDLNGPLYGVPGGKAAPGSTVFQTPGGSTDPADPNDPSAPPAPKQEPA